MAESNGSSGPGLLSDDPRDGTGDRPDELDRQRYADHVAKLLDNVRSQSESAVLALIGDWGSGKSSVLEMLERQLQSPWCIAVFNPWTYSDTSTLHRGFFNELMAALPEGDQPGTARKKVGEFARTISPLGKFGSLIGLDAEGVIRAAGDLIAGDTSASAAKKVAEEALRAASLPVLMVVDDLDRLTPDELLEVLKLVRLVGRLPNVYYLLSYDERTLLDVLRRTAVTGDDEQRSRAYLEKIVQVRLDMPSLRGEQRARLLNDGLDQVGSSVGLNLTEEDQRRLGDLYFSVLDRRLRTPRAITRFLGQIQAFYPLLHGEVDFVDFFLVNWLRTQETGVYRMLQMHRDDLLGRDFSNLAHTRDAAAQTERRERWVQRLSAAQVEEADLPGVVKVLSALFPQVEAAFTDAQYVVKMRPRTTPKAISHVDYFDRYVSFGVPQGDVSDADVAAAVDDLRSNSDGPAVARLAAEVAGETARAMRKLEALRDTGTPLPEKALFDLIAHTSPLIDRARNGTFDNPWLDAVRGGTTCLTAMGTADAVDAVNRLGSVEDYRNYVIDVVRFLKTRSTRAVTGPLPPTFDLPQVVSAATAVITSTLARSTANSPLDDGAMTNFWTWWILDPTEASDWLRSQVDAERWTLAETMGALTTTTTAVGAANPTRMVGDFDLAVVDEAFGLEHVLSALESEIDAVLPFDQGSFRIPANPENRVRAALLDLKRERAARTNEGDEARDAVPQEAPASEVGD